MSGFEETIMSIHKDVKDILIALRGDIKTKEPGLIDDVREVKKAINVNRRQHTWLFGLCAAAILATIFGILGGDMSGLVELAARILAVVK